MRIPIVAGSRRLKQRLVPAAVLAVLGAVALPAAAQAGTAEVRDGRLLYTARNAEVNNVDLRVGPTGRLVISDAAPRIAGAGCLLNGSGDLECDASGVTAVEMSLADRNDVVRYRVPHPGTVNAGIGTDMTPASEAAVADDLHVGNSPLAARATARLPAGRAARLTVPAAGHDRVPGRRDRDPLWPPIPQR